MVDLFYSIMRLRFRKVFEFWKFQDGRQGEDFYLVQMYPRREFSDITKTFAELGLAPSATILVVSVSFKDFAK